MVWLNYEFAWGGAYQNYYKEQSINGIVIDKDHLQPLKFQGQYYDPETSLHYNRFRYYDSDVGMFISRDPIGLLGGLNTFQYAPNPILWVDPFGLTSASQILSSNMKKAGNPVPSGYAAHHKISTNVVLKHDLTKEAMKRGIYDPNRAQNGVGLPMKSAESLATGKPLHSGGHLASYYEHVTSLLDKQLLKLGDLTKATDKQILSKIGAVERLLHIHLENDKIRLQATDPRPVGTKSKC